MEKNVLKNKSGKGNICFFMSKCIIKRMIFLKNELLKWHVGARGPRTLGQPWAPQHGDLALVTLMNTMWEMLFQLS